MILRSASSREAQEPQDAVCESPAPEPATRLLSGKRRARSSGYSRSPQVAILL